MSIIIEYQLVEPIIRLKNAPNFKRILNTLPVRAKALLQCALDFYRTAIIWFIGYGAKLRTSFLFGNQIGTKRYMNHSHKHLHLIQTITVR